MTARPGRFKAVLDIDLAHPRDFRSDKFHAFERQVYEQLDEELAKTFNLEGKDRRGRPEQRGSFGPPSMRGIARNVPKPPDTQRHEHPPRTTDVNVRGAPVSPRRNGIEFMASSNRTLLVTSALPLRERPDPPRSHGGVHPDRHLGAVPARGAAIDARTCAPTTDTAPRSCSRPSRRA